MSEVRYAMRQLLKSPGFTLVAILGLALGIGANVAFFSVVNSVFLRPLPYREPDRLVRLSSTNEAQHLTRVGFSYPRYLAVQERQQVFSDLALSVGNAVHVDRPRRSGTADRPAGLGGAAAGAGPASRRSVAISRPAEDRPGGEHVVLISHAMWQQRFNRDPSVLGQALTLDGAPYTIIGVLPEAATAFPLNQLQIWVPRPAEVPFLVPSQLNGGGFFFQAIARLRPGVSLAQAREAMNVVAASYRAGEPRQRRRAVADRRRAAAGPGARRLASVDIMLFGAVGLVLLIACANIANLLLSRRRRPRQKELAVRAPRWAPHAPHGSDRQLVTESLLLSVHRRGAGGGAGLLVLTALLARLAIDLDSARARDPDRSARAGLRAGRVARHRAGDRPAARVAGRAA